MKPAFFNIPAIQAMGPVEKLALITALTRIMSYGTPINGGDANIHIFKDLLLVIAGRPSDPRNFIAHASEVLDEDFAWPKDATELVEIPDGFTTNVMQHLRKIKEAPKFTTEIYVDYSINEQEFDLIRLMFI